MWSNWQPEPLQQTDTCVVWQLCHAIWLPSFSPLLFTTLSVTLFLFSFVKKTYCDTCSFLPDRVLFSTDTFYGVRNSFLLCRARSFALLIWTWQPRSPGRSLRISGSTPTLLLPAVSRAHKQARVCVCVCALTLKHPTVVASSGSVSLIANTDACGAFLSVHRDTHPSYKHMIQYLNTFECTNTQILIWHLKKSCPLN